MAAAPATPAAPGRLHLVLFSRAPVPGRTKTRLSPPLSAEQARDLHVACLNDLLAAGRDWQAARAAAGGPPVRLHLFITPPASQPTFRAAGVAWPDDCALHNQRGEGLGARMEDAIRRVRGDTGADSAPAVLLTGTDLPLLGAAHWDAAAAALGVPPAGRDSAAAAEVVFGPTPDGGYYLVGTRCDPAGLFALEGWGGASVLERSLAAARAAGRHAALIETLPDADTAADLRAVLAHPRAAALGERESLRLLRAWVEA